MTFDLEHSVLDSATELFRFALKETSTEAQYCKAVEEVVGEVLARHPDISPALLYFAMGRALGKFEAERNGGGPKKKR
jgi:hypothetical protein